MIDEPSLSYFLYVFMQVYRKDTIHRELLGTKKMSGLSFWAKGYCASTVGLDEEVIKKYIREQNNKH